MDNLGIYLFAFICDKCIEGGGGVSQSQDQNGLYLL